jgi:hypothetical protein
MARIADIITSIGASIVEVSNPACQQAHEMIFARALPTPAPIPAACALVAVISAI